MRLDNGQLALKRAAGSSASERDAVVQSLLWSQNTLVIGESLELKRAIICRRTLDCLCRVILTGEKSASRAKLCTKSALHSKTPHGSPQT